MAGLESPDFTVRTLTTWIVEPHQQTVFGWFENDVYIGLLMLANCLGVLRLRRVDLLS